MKIIIFPLDKLSRLGEGVFMKKIFVALSMVAFLAACDDSSSASAENSEPATLSSAEGQESSSSKTNGTGISSSVTLSPSTNSGQAPLSAESNGSSSSEQNVASSSSEKLSDTSSSSADKIAYGSMTDGRDGHVYKTVQIGEQIWMAENLNFDPDQDGSGGRIYSWSWCYNKDLDSCSKYGRFYTWAAAMDSAGKWSENGKGCGYNDRKCRPTYPVRGVCPEGWHLPDSTEWNTLIIAAGDTLTGGKVLKSRTGWDDGGDGTDDLGFSALSVGFRDLNGNYLAPGHSTFFWSSSELKTYFAYHLVLEFFSDEVHLTDSNEDSAYSVRCVKD